MPDGVRNGIVDTSSNTNFLIDDEEEEEDRSGRSSIIIESNGDNNGGITTTIPSSILVENDTTGTTGRNKGNNRAKSLQTQSQGNSLNFFDLLKTGTMVGEKNGNSGTSPRLRLSSGPRDSDYVILVLNQKQREDDEVSMLIDRLRENGVSCLFMKNGTNNNSSTVKSPNSLPPLPTAPSLPEAVSEVTSSTKSSLFLSPSKSSEKVQNGKSCGCLCKCNGVCVSRTCLQISNSDDVHIRDEGVNNVPILINPSSSDSQIRDDSKTHNNASIITSKASNSTPLILRLPIPVLKITPPPSNNSHYTNEAQLTEQDSNTKLVNGEEDTTSQKRKRKRRRKYPYVIKKTVKKRKLSVDELIILPPPPPDTTVIHELDKVSSPKFSPTLLPQPIPQRPIRVQKSKAKLGRPPKKLKLKSIPTQKSRVKPTTRLSPLQPQPSPSDDPYVFIPDDEFDDFEPIPKLFSPNARKNGLCSPNHAMVTVGVPYSSPTLTVPVSYSSPTISNDNKSPVPSTPLASASPKQEQPQEEPPKIETNINSSIQEENSLDSSELKKKAKRKKRKNEVSQLLTWAISPRPSTPRSTLITAFLPKETKEQQQATSAVSTTSIANNDIIPIIPNTTPSAVEVEVIATETSGMVQEEVSIAQPSQGDSKQADNLSPQSEEPSPAEADLNHDNTREEIVHKEEEVAETIRPLIEKGTTMALPSVRAPWGSRKGKAYKRKRKRRSELHYKVKKSKVIISNNKNCVQEEISSALLDDKTNEGEGELRYSELTSVVGELESILSTEKSDLKLDEREHLIDQDPLMMIIPTLSPNKCDLTSLEESNMNSTTITVDETGLESVSSKETGLHTSITNAVPCSSELLTPVLSSNTSILPIPEILPPSNVDEVWKVPAIPEPLPSTSSSIGATTTPTDSEIPNSFLDAMQLRRPSFYSLIAGNVRNNMENFLDGRPSSSSTNGGDGGGATKAKRKRRPRPRNGFLLHHGDNFPEDPEAPYKLHLATQIILKLNKRRSKFKPKVDKGKSLLSYLKLVPKRVSRTSKASAPVVVAPSEDDKEKVPTEEEMSSRITSVFSGEWVQPKNFICNICGHVEKDFWDMVHHKGEIHPGIVVTHVELQDMPPQGFREPPPIPSNVGVPPPPPCTKCSASFSTYPDLHLHIFECAGNTTWLNELKEEEAQPQRKKKSKRKRGFNRFKRRMSNTPRKCNPRLKTDSSVSLTSKILKEVFKCEFCTREFKTEGWLKNHLTTHSLPISIPLSKLLKQSLPPRASNTIGRRSVVQNLLANGSFKT